MSNKYKFDYNKLKLSVKKLFDECKQKYNLEEKDIIPTGKQKNHPYIGKDIRLACSKKKPAKPYLSCGYTLFSILSNLSNMTKKFLKNENISYYIIIFDIKGKNLGKSILYRLPHTYWIYQNRVLGINGDPISLQLDK